MIHQETSSLLQSKTPQTRFERLTWLLLKKVLKTRPAQPHLRGKLSDTDTKAEICSDCGKGAENSRVSGHARTTPL
jgi:hypothetical protein